MATLVAKKPRKAIEDEQLGDGKPHPGRRMTEAEFVEWCDEWTRAEWVDGEVVMMAPGNTEHEEIQLSVGAGMNGLAEQGDLGKVTGNAIQIRLPGQKRRRLPDLLFVSKDRLHIVKKTYCDGAPDLILEIVSPESLGRDLRDKFLEYEKAGVREYWIVDPQNKRIDAYELGGGKKYREITEVDGKLCSKVIKGFFLRRAWILREKFPSMLTLLKELKIKLPR